ncbi:MAG: DUF3078 domain-containing protein, partial [Flavobacteriales bacterium]|nr:DUF3078 domain-containing protein [Flavobacteriales bacterium]
GFLLIGFIATSFFGFAGDDKKIDSANKPAQAKSNYNADSTWKWGGIMGLNFSQVAIGEYWAKGGLSSYSFNGLLGLYANHKKGKISWDNNLDLAYGMIKQGNRDQIMDQPWLKSDDKLAINVKVGYQIKDKKISLSGLVNFKSQNAPGFNYPNDSVLSSNFLAPGYLVFGAGIDYKPTSNLSIFISPVSAGKITFVNDQALANAGAFGVEPGERMRAEFGGFLKLLYKKDNLSKDKESALHDISFQTQLDLFSNYLNNPENIDVNWSILIGLKVNKYISATITSNVIYDHDVKFTIEEKDANGNVISTHLGPRLQFKESLGIGLSYKF